jgi:hypothetical protein
MVGNDPTQATRLLRVDVPARDRTFLLELIAMVRDGVREELIGFSDRHPRVRQLRREEIAYERILIGLAGGELAVDHDVRAALVELAEVVDASNEYARVAFEHEALSRLIAVVGRGA